MAVQKNTPDHTALRTALWRALHVEIDSKPHVFTDEIGVRLVNEDNWRSRPDMNPDFCKSMRASIVGRARFIEDLVEENSQKKNMQYVILGAGLESFAQRRPEIARHLQIFELDQPSPQAWKQQRLKELGYETPDYLHFVPVNFEAGQSWWEQIIAAGFNKSHPAVVVSTGVSMYLSREANFETLKQVAELASGSTLAMTFMLALELLPTQERAIMEFVMKRAAESSTPFLSLFKPEEILDLANRAGFKKADYVSADDIFQRYFAQRTDGLNAGTAEAFLLATT